MIPRVPRRDPDVTHPEIEILVAFDVLNRYGSNFFMHLEIGVLRHLEFHVELCVAADGRMKFDIRIVVPNLEVQVRVFHVAFTPRLHRVMHPDLIGVAAQNAQVAHFQPCMHQASSNELAHLVVTLLIAPVFPVVRGGTQWRFAGKRFLWSESQAEAEGNPGEPQESTEP